MAELRGDGGRRSRKRQASAGGDERHHMPLPSSSYRRRRPPPYPLRLFTIVSRLGPHTRRNIQLSSVDEHPRERSDSRSREWHRHPRPPAAELRPFPPLPQFRPLHAHERQGRRLCVHKRPLRQWPPVAELAAGQLQRVAERHRAQLHPRQSTLCCQVRFSSIVIVLLVCSPSKTRIQCPWFLHSSPWVSSSTPSEGPTTRT